jgi:hypothetical protein
VAVDGKPTSTADVLVAVVAIAHYFAARAPAAMITKIAKPIIAHQAMLSVSLCHLRTSHMTQTPFRRDCPS